MRGEVGGEEEEKYNLLNIAAVLRWSSPGYSCQRTDKCCDQHYRKEVSIVLYNITRPVMLQATSLFSSSSFSSIDICFFFSQFHVVFNGFRHHSELQLSLYRFIWMVTLSFLGRWWIPSYLLSSISRPPHQVDILN